LECGSEAAAFASDGIQKAAASLPHSKAPPGASLSISHRFFNPALLVAPLACDAYGECLLNPQEPQNIEYRLQNAEGSVRLASLLRFAICNRYSAVPFV